MHRYDIGIAFYHVSHILCHDFLLGKRDCIQDLAFMVYPGFGRIDILRHAFIRPQDTSSETKHPAGQTVYREDDPSPESVEQPPGFRLLYSKAALDQILLIVTVFQGSPRERVPCLRAVPQLELLDDGI